MFQRISSQKEAPVPLSLDAGQRIVTPDLDPVLGWIGAESARVAQALILPPWLTEPCPTTSIAYACNLPAAWPGQKEPCGSARPGGQPPAGTVEPEAEAAFLASSLPGGQVSIVSDGGIRNTISFRWVCLTAHTSIGAVWRLFLNLRPSGVWTAAGHDYVFEAGGGALLNGLGNLTIVLGGRAFTLTHPEGKLTCLPSKLGRVKITQLTADGWAKRQVLSLMLYPGRSIAATFSDGRKELIATAASPRAAAAIAA